LWVGVLIPGAAYLRYSLNGQPPALQLKDYGVWLWALITHVCFFAGLISIINLVRTLSDRSRNISASRFVMFLILAWLAVRVLFVKVIDPAVPFTGVEAEIYATAIALASVAWGASLRIMWLRRSPATSTPQRPKSRRRTLTAALVFSAAFAFTAPAFIGLLDWNGILEKLSAVLLWVILLGVLLPLWPAWQKSAPSLSRPVAWVILTASLLAASTWAQSHLATGSGVKSQNAIREAFGRHAFMDPSVQVIGQTLAIGHTAPCDALCEFLNQQTNIPPSMEVKAVDIGLVQELKPTKMPRPNIFIVVVDSPVGAGGGGSSVVVVVLEVLVVVGGLLVVVVLVVVLVVVVVLDVVVVVGGRVVVVVVLVDVVVVGGRVVVVVDVVVVVGG